MEKLKQKHIFLIVLLTIIIFVCSITFAGCEQYELISGVIGEDYEIDRIVYTNQVDKYLAGKTLLTGKVTSGSNTVVDFGKFIKDYGIYACRNDDGTIDIVLDTAKIYNQSDNSVALNNIWTTTDCLYMYILHTSNVNIEGVYENNCVVNSHKYLFSDRTHGIKNNYELIKMGNDECTCGIVDTSDLGYYGVDYRCGCYAEGLGTSLKFEEGEYYADDFNASDVPLCCYDVEEKVVEETTDVQAQVFVRKQIYKNELGEEVVGSSIEEYIYDGNIIGTGNATQIDTTEMEFVREDYVETGSKTVSWTHEVTKYVVTHTCTCHIVAEYSQPELAILNCTQLDLEKEQVFPKFNELIIDGFDFTYIDSLIEATINPMKENSVWEEYEYEKLLDLNNYSHMFENLPCKRISLNNITGIKYDVEDLSYMFSNCENLQYVDFGNFFENLKPTDISYMFYNCPNLQYVDLTTLDTSKVTNMENMFSNYFKARECFFDNELNKLISASGGTDIQLTNNGEPWTLNSFILFVISQDEGLNEQYLLEPEKTFKLLRIELLNSFLDLLGNDAFPISYDEFVIYITGGQYFSELEFLDAVNEDPTQFGLTAKENDEKYTIEEIEIFIQSQIASDEDSKLLQITKAENLDEFFAYMQGCKRFENDVEEINFLFKNSGKICSLLEELDLPLTNNDKPWTLETLTEYITQTADEFAELGDLSPTHIKILIKSKIVELGYNIKFDFDEAALLFTDFQVEAVNNFEDLLTAINKNPLDFGFEEKEGGELYSDKEIKTFLMTKFAESGLIICSDEEMSFGGKKYYTYEYTEVQRSRTDIINESINSIFVPYLNKNEGFPLTNNGEPWTWESVALYWIELNDELKQSYLENPKILEFVKINLLAEMIGSGLSYDLIQIPLLYSELICSLTNGECSSIEEYIAFLGQKEDGNFYSEDEIKTMLQNKISEDGLTNQLIDVDNYAKTIYVVQKVYKTGTVLVLGGESSKFKVTNNMNTQGMLLGNFATIVAPTIEEGVVIELPDNYFSDNKNKTQLTFEDSNKTYILGIYPETPKTDEGDENNKNLYESNNQLNMILVLIAVITACVVVIIKLRKV
ncbi:MAG: BspA family leucine-rich repeat surface protein [Candidatus Caccovivens sp.]